MRSRGSTLVEFALAWPLVLALVYACIQLAIWGAEEHAAHSAALAGVRAGSAANGDAGTAAEIAVAVLRPSLVGASLAVSCADADVREPGAFVCARELTGAVDVTIAGSVPALVPLMGSGLPISAHAVIAKEAFAR